MVSVKWARILVHHIKIQKLINRHNGDSQGDLIVKGSQEP